MYFIQTHLGYHTDMQSHFFKFTIINSFICRTCNTCVALCSSFCLKLNGSNKNNTENCDVVQCAGSTYNSVAEVSQVFKCGRRISLNYLSGNHT